MDDVDALRCLIDANKIDVLRYRTFDYRQDTCLYLAARYRDNKCMQLLYDLGVEQISNQNGDYPIHVAVVVLSRNIVELMVARNRDRLPCLEAFLQHVEQVVRFNI